jgi:hypothetical protein
VLNLSDPNSDLFDNKHDAIFSETNAGMTWA